jgi:hypothetical protein
VDHLWAALVVEEEEWAVEDSDRTLVAAASEAVEVGQTQL